MNPLALDYISISGFKSIASIEKLPLRPINILIGANGSGKSNFIGVFTFLNQVREGRLQDYVVASGGAERILHFGSKSTKEMSFFLSFRQEVNQYLLKLAHTREDSLYPQTEWASFWNRPNYSKPKLYWIDAVQSHLEAGISNPQLSGVAGFVRGRLDGWRVYHVHDTSSSSPMRKASSIDDNRSLRTDGGNLAAFLYLLLQKHRDSYEMIRRTVARVAPFFDDFSLAPLKLRPDAIKLEWRHKNSDLYFDAASLSDGTLRFISLATLFLQPVAFRPSVILVDEPELGLHPYAIDLLASLIKSASVDTQVIVSTQSSLLLDHFQPEDVLIADRKDDSTCITRADPDRLAIWLEDYSLGQLWEKNEIGGRPSPA